jgi:hypothetical protein
MIKRCGRVVEEEPACRYIRVFRKFESKIHCYISLSKLLNKALMEITPKYKLVSGVHVQVLFCLQHESSCICMIEAHRIKICFPISSFIV